MDRYRARKYRELKKQKINSEFNIEGPVSNLNFDVPMISEHIDNVDDPPMVGRSEVCTSFDECNGIEELPDVHSSDYDSDGMLHVQNNCTISSDYDSDGMLDVQNNCTINWTMQGDDDVEMKENPRVFKQCLREWAINNINTLTMKTVDELLILLREFGHDDLPKRAETLLRTKRTVNKIVTMKSKKGTDGKYIYSGIENALRNQIKRDLNLEDNILNILVNIDGLPLYNKSCIQLWPILIQICLEGYHCQPLLVGMYCGDSKPASAMEFLKDFIEEFISLRERCFQIEDRQYFIQIKAFVCDTPARAFIKCCKGHGGFYCCERCEIRGKTRNGKRVYEEANCRRRTKISFKTQRQKLHHHENVTSPLLSIPDFDPVRQVVLDYMHLLCNGVMKTLLEKWIGPKKNPAKLGRQQLTKFRNLCLALKGSVPKEFQRKTFDLAELPNWKATQFRFFLLYAGPVILKSVLTKRYYRHFLLLAAASRILCDTVLIKTHTDIADNLLLQFYRRLRSLYGQSILVMNFHNLIHLADDVREMEAPLSSYSAFPFENVLGLIKKLVRTPRNPVAQIFRRLSELEIMDQELKKNVVLNNRVECKRTMSAIEYSSIHFRSLFYISINEPDNIVEVQKGNKHIFLQVERIYCHPSSLNDIYMEGHLLKMTDFFQQPLLSAEIGIYKRRQVHNSQRQTYSIHSLIKKCLLINIEETTSLITILHA